ANVLAKKKAQRAGADEVLLIDRGIVREGASATFFGVRGGAAITHPLDEHILPGVVRDRILRLARAAGIPVEERPLDESELFDVDEAFITSTSMGVMPVSAIDGRPMRRGPLTPLLQRLLDEEEARDVSS
ncbi:MAG TPA: aminotransferase class IV, partial [Thermoanaerobaculia bacterium]